MQQLITSAKHGDERAWSQLYRLHEPWLYATALRICGNTTEAKDAVQDTLLQAFLKLGQLNDAAAFPAWLKTCLLRHCYRYKNKESRALSLQHTSLSKEYWEDSIHSTMENYARQSKIHDTLSGLSESLQVVILLRYFSTYRSYEQIASILCIPVGTVRSRLNQAKLKLSEQWRRCGEDDDRSYKMAQYWNEKYAGYFGDLHASLTARENLLEHLDKDLELTFSSGKTGRGRTIIAEEIEGDLIHGNTFSSTEVMTSGQLSLIEVRNNNSVEFPDRCPDSSILVVWREKNLITRMTLHNSH